jgi:hypothetical protein
MSCRSRPLSTTELCWKKICQGVMVVPMLARMMKRTSPPLPPGKVGMKSPCHLAPAGCRRCFHGPERRRHVDHVERAEEQGQFLEGPVFPAHHDGEQDGRDPRTVSHGGTPKEAHRRGHADVFGDERQPVDDGEIAQREPAPELAEPLEDGLGMAALGDRAQAHRHLLDVVGHG